jgi:uncharacterized cupin superfamily protein
MKIVRTEDLPWTQAIDRGPYAGRRKQLAGDKLSCGLWELPPGKRSFPLHLHHITEEALFVLSGHAKVRTPDGETAIGPGDWVSFAPGGPAHQLVNDGEETLRYVAIAATSGVDVVEYPETKKVAYAVGKFPNAKRQIFRSEDERDYWDREEEP